MSRICIKCNKITEDDYRIRTAKGRIRQLPQPVCKECFMKEVKE